MTSEKNNKPKLVLFLGAGASAPLGSPTSRTFIKELFKKELFEDSNQSLYKKEHAWTRDKIIEMLNGGIQNELKSLVKPFADVLASIFKTRAVKFYKDKAGQKDWQAHKEIDTTNKIMESFNLDILYGVIYSLDRKQSGEENKENENILEKYQTEVEEIVNNLKDSCHRHKIKTTESCGLRKKTECFGKSTTDLKKNIELILWKKYSELKLNENKNPLYNLIEILLKNKRIGNTGLPIFTTNWDIAIEETLRSMMDNNKYMVNFYMGNFFEKKNGNHCYR